MPSCLQCRGDNRIAAFKYGAHTLKIGENMNLGWFEYKRAEKILKQTMARQEKASLRQHQEQLAKLAAQKPMQKQATEKAIATYERAGLGESPLKRQKCARDAAAADEENPPVLRHLVQSAETADAIAMAGGDVTAAEAARRAYSALR